MRKILSIAWNDIRIEFSHRSTLVFFLVLPLVFTTVIGVGLQNVDGSDSDSRFLVLVVDKDRSPVSEALADAMESSEVIRPMFEDQDEAERLLEEEGDVSALASDDSQVYRTVSFKVSLPKAS